MNNGNRNGKREEDVRLAMATVLAVLLSSSKSLLNCSIDITNLAI